MFTRYYLGSLILTLLLACQIQSLTCRADEGSGVPTGQPPNDSETEVSDEDEEFTIEPNWNLPLKTSPLTQWWTDHLYRGGYRLQQHAVTRHWRLIGADHVRRAWGTRQQCVSVLDSLSPKAELPAEPQHVVVMLHGLMRTRNSMKPLEAKLHQAGHDQTIRFSYASTRNSIGDSARSLRELLEDFPANTTFSFVGHSMGNIVVRHMIGDLQRDDDPAQLLGRCKSMVMLGPPNQGAAIARRLAPTGLYGWVTGKGGLELGPEWESFVKKLATPPFPFAIIAGDVSSNLVQNPLVDGSGDLVVSLEEAELEGRCWLKTVPVLHSFLMKDPVTMSMTIEFIEEHS